MHRIVGVHGHKKGKRQTLKESEQTIQLHDAAQQTSNEILMLLHHKHASASECVAQLKQTVQQTRKTMRMFMVFHPKLFEDKKWVFETDRVYFQEDKPEDE
eukprot:SAG11_NODE_26858_length_339_cov_212.741667_1_plen_100_part_10